MKTKDRILDAALRLFNEQGTAAISTNHIAEAAVMSPGNLYYHYGNKDEIIRALFERLFALTDTAFALPDHHLPTLADALALVTVNFKIMADYRFVYRELLALLRQDTLLHERYMAIRQRGYDGFREIILALKHAGVFAAAIDDTTVNHLADLCWLISEFWLATLEVRGQPLDDPHIERGTALMLFVLKPYLSP